MPQFTDEEIREMIREFRRRTRPEHRCEDCPFPGRLVVCCRICDRLFKRISPFCRLIYNPVFRCYKTVKLNCPCSLYGPEYTAEKIAKFMDEV